MDSYTKYIADIFKKEKDEFFQHFKGKFPGISDEVLYNRIQRGYDCFNITGIDQWNEILNHNPKYTYFESWKDYLKYNGLPYKASELYKDYF